MGIASHVYLLSWEVVLAVPAIVLFNGRDAEHTVEGVPSGVAFFIFVAVVAAAGCVFVCLRECCGWCFATRWAANLLLAAYLLAQLLVCAWSLHYAWIYIAGIRSGEAKDGEPLDSGEIVWYYLGATASVLLGLCTLLVCCSTVSIMNLSFSRENKKGDEEERQPLVGTQGIQHT